jgi:hypothetical protein
LYRCVHDYQSARTSSVRTLKLANVLGPNVLLIATISAPQRCPVSVKKSAAEAALK